MRTIVGTSFLVAMFVAIVGCSNGPSGDASGQLQVVATTTMIADTVRVIGGDHVRVESLMGPGVDPHRYTPSPGDLARLHDAKIVFYNGLHLEGKMTDVLERSDGGDGRVIAVTRDLNPVTDLRHVDGGEIAHDPHVWFDVKLWIRCVAVVRDALIEADPGHAEEYRANAAQYTEELARLDDEIRAKAETLPADKRVLVTSHDAFGYFGAAYGFEVHGLQGVSTAAEVPLSEVQGLAKFLGDRRVPAVFGETSVPPKGLQKVLDTVKSEYGRDVRLIGGEDALYSDALGPAGSPGETYTGMVRHNVSVIVGALGRP